MDRNLSAYTNTGNGRVPPNFDIQNVGRFDSQAFNEEFERYAVGIRKIVPQNESEGRMLYESLAKARTEDLQTSIENVADVNGKVLDGTTPLHLATYSGHEENLILLIESGADVNAKDEKFGMTPLHVASWFDKLNALSILLELGADTDAIDDFYGMSPLHVASLLGKPAFVKVLIDAGVDVNVTEKKIQFQCTAYCFNSRV